MKINRLLILLVKFIIPNIFLNLLKQKLYTKINKKFSNNSLESKFTYIYKNNLWGNLNSEIHCSGAGSYFPSIINPYINKVKKILLNNNKPTVVDLGCGDFNIGSKLIETSKKYIAIDIVENVIKNNKNKYKNVIFLKRDITRDNIPKADFGIIRQVLQHLGNAEIALFLKNIKNKFRYLIVTEHLPKKKFVPNVDIKTSCFNRTIFNSGVILHKKPFNLKYKYYKNILEVNSIPDNGKIRTILYKLF
jgi:hypothetical protein